jgi:hypothetical protein
MSGSKGGCVTLAAEWLGQKIDRNACVLHVLHLAFASVKKYVWVVAKPTKKNLHAPHVWSACWWGWTIFGEDSTEDHVWTELCQVQGEARFVKCTKPMENRWLFEHSAADWLIENRLLLLKILPAYVATRGSKSTQVTSLETMLRDRPTWLLIRVYKKYCDLFLVPAHLDTIAAGVSCAVEPAHPGPICGLLPPGFKAPCMPEMYARWIEELDQLAANVSTVRIPIWFAESCSVVRIFAPKSARRSTW